MLPSLWLFQIAYQALSPLVDLQILWTIVTTIGAMLRFGLDQDWQPFPIAAGQLYIVAFMYAFFFVIELIGSAVAFKLDREDPRMLVWLFWQRFLYRQLMYAVLLKSIKTAISGIRAGWGKLERKGTVELSAPEHRTVVVEGEAFAFSVATEKPAYIMMLSIDPAGTVNVLYPSDTDTKPALLTPGAPLLVSSPQLRVQVPFGIEHIVVAATQSPPVGLMRLAGRRVGPDSQLRPDLERIIQDAERAGAKASLRFQTVESGVSSP